MTQAEELLKEAADQLQHLMYACDMTGHLEEETIMVRAKITAYLDLKSQESSVVNEGVISWEQARNKKVREYNYDNWDHFVENCTGIGQMEAMYEECFATFMEANRQQRWIPVEERLPDVFDVLVIDMVDAAKGETYPVIKWAAFLEEEKTFHTDREQIWPTHWQPLPEIPKEVKG